MSRYETSQLQFVLPRPGRVLKVVLVGLFAIWLVFAVALNWGDASEQAFLILCGNTERILDGEVWRLFTAPLMHVPSGTIGHILTALLGLYFLAPSLEEAWGSKRFAYFLFWCGVLGYATQILVTLIVPAAFAAKLVGSYWFGAVPVVEAVAIAWALSFRGQVVRLMFILPVSSRGLIVFVVAMSLMYLFAGAQTPSGLIAPFGGMLWGWLLGGDTPSPIRRAWLQFRLGLLEAEARRDRRQRRERAKRSGFRVIDGEGRPDDSERRSRGKRGNGGWLN